MWLIAILTRARAVVLSMKRSGKSLLWSFPVNCDKCSKPRILRLFAKCLNLILVHSITTTRNVCTGCLSAHMISSLRCRRMGYSKWWMW